MKSWSIRISVLWGALLVGCSSTTTMTYDLNAPTESIGKPQTNTVQYRLASVEVPEAFDVASLIVRQPDNSLMVLSHDQWVGSLGQALRSGLTSALTQTIGIPPLPANMQSAIGNQDTDRITVTIEQFDMQPAKQATLTALWQVDFDDRQRQSITCYSVLTATVKPGVAALVSAQQRNVSELGQIIANTLRTGEPAQDSNCRVVAIR